MKEKEKEMATEILKHMTGLLLQNAQKKEKSI